jgi:hypothetical protein
MESSNEGRRGSEPDRARSQVGQRQFDPATEGELTSAIVCAVAEAEGVDPVEIGSPPLYESVDVCSLDDVLFGSRGSAPAEGRVAFEYHGYLVAVRADGWVRVYAGTV